MKLGKLVTKFFKRTLKLHITTNTIRSLVETSAGQLHLQGEINGTDRAAIMHINGHSSATVEKFYMKHNLKSDVTNAKCAFQKMLPGCEQDSDGGMINSDDEMFGPDARASFSSSNSAPREDDIPCVHPDILSPKKRIPWTSYEINFVGKWCDKNSKCPNMVAQCLKAIHSDSSIKSHFHPSHIEDSTRLRHGLQAYQKKMESQEF